MSDYNSDMAPGGVGGAKESFEQQAPCSMKIEGTFLVVNPPGLTSTRDSSHSLPSRNGKDSVMILETTKSNRSSNFQSPPRAYSLLSGGSEHNPASTSGCSSGQSARLQSQKELSCALRELKIHLPAERKGRACRGTLAALKYALNCVKKVRANQEYYHQWNVEDSHGLSLDLSAFTFAELDNITSEYTLKNTETFSMAVSFLSGKVVYVSPRGSSLLRSTLELLQGVLFSELLAPQDVSTFYSGTSPCRLPHWPTGMGSESPMDCGREKSMFCRISGGRKFEGGVRYYPFRLTPYQLTLCDSDACDPQPCCLLMAERVHSGYEAPRIPPDKRIFTTSHTPSCLFQEVDERAVALLGYLPQDLLGAPVLFYLHPDDRPVMVAIHKKILQFAGQPFDHSPLRLCARSGEYLTIDTSWSSFVNPWSRKVAFIVGRHKVRTSPLSEDVFTPPRGEEGRAVVPEILRLSEQIHCLLLQPSLCAPANEEYPGNASSSDSLAASEDPFRPYRPMTFQQMCKDVHALKSSGQQVFFESRNRPVHRKPPSAGAEGTLKVADTSKMTGGVTKQISTLQNTVSPPVRPVRKENTPAFSYQQINCLDSIIRYLESCNLPYTVKRKCASSSGAMSSISEDKQESRTPIVALGADPTPLPPLAMTPKAESMMSVTSQCSFSSTIVHVGDKKPLESDIVMEEAPPMSVPALPSTVAPPPSASPAHAAPEQDGERQGAGCVGLTKEALLAHTQQEEQTFLGQFQDLSRLQKVDLAPGHAPYTTTQRSHATFFRAVRSSRDYPTVTSSGRRRGRGGKRLKHQETSDLGSSLGAGPVFSGPSRDLAGHLISVGPQTSSSSWPNSVGSQASLPPVPYHPSVLPLYPHLAPPVPHPTVGVPNSDTSLRLPLLSAPLAPPPRAPIVAFVLPDCIFPQPDPQIPQPNFPVSSVHQDFYHIDQVFPFSHSTSVAPTPLLPPGQPAATTRSLSRSSTLQSCSQAPPERDGAGLPLFQSRCFSPLNQLQLEESQPACNGLEVASAPIATQQATTPLNGATQNWTAKQRSVAGENTLGNRSNTVGDNEENENTEANESSNQDVMSTSSGLLGLMLQEDFRSGTSSAASGSESLGSLGSGFNGCSLIKSGTRSSLGNHTSRYFGSIDSSEKCLSWKWPEVGAGEEHFIKCVLQDPIWLLMADADEKVMMTYQLPVRDREQVLREDRMALRSMQKQQPRFTEQQKRELSQVHPWIRTGCLPPDIDILVCPGCGSMASVPEATPFNVQMYAMELSGVLDPPLPEGAGAKSSVEEEGGGAPSETSDQEMRPEETGSDLAFGSGNRVV